MSQPMWSEIRKLFEEKLWAQLENKIKLGTDDCENI